MRDITAAVSKKAQELAQHEGGFPPQKQDPPGHTGPMDPAPDHGEYSYTGTGKLQDLCALVTGGDSGIGRAVAIAFAREGADVAITYLPAEQEDAEQTAQWVQEAGRKAVLIAADLQDEQACDQVITTAVNEMGALDILVNNAGYQMARDDSLEEFSTQRMDHTFKTNLYAMFWLTQRALEHLPRGGSIINTSSIQAFIPSPKLLDYSATKAAINNFTVNLASQVGERGIRVNAVAPGPIWTPLQPATQDPEHLAQFGKNTPLGRAGQPSEVAPAYVFFASPSDASYVSGTVLGVTGGKAVF